MVQNAVADKAVPKDMTEKPESESVAEYDKLVSYLDQERSLLQAVVDQMPSGLYIAEAPSGSIVLRNKEADRILGHPPCEEYGDFGAVHSDGTPYRREDYPMYRAIYLGETIDQEEMIYHRPDNAIIHLSVSAAPVYDKQGRITIGVLVFSDITERKHTEIELSESRTKLKEHLVELERINTELSEYAYAASHDLKAPLRAIRNYADFLYQDLADTLAGEQRQYLEGLKKATTQGEELINDLLLFSRIARVPQEIESVDLADLSREVCSVVNVPADTKLITPEDWPAVHSDRTLLRQILQNLLSNALKFTPPAGRRIELGWQTAEDGRFELFVRDNGIGIDPQYVEQIFGIFKRLHPNHEYEGTGIGLAIVKKAANKLGGSVRVESMPGEGSTFYVNLPLRFQN